MLRFIEGLVISGDLLRTPPIFTGDDMGCYRQAIPGLKAPKSHAQAIHDAPGVNILRMANCQQLGDVKFSECKGCHGLCRFSSQALVPEVWMETPTDLYRISS